MTAEERTLSLPGVDTAPRVGPQITVTISYPYGVHPLVARANLEAALRAGALACALARLGLEAEIGTL